MELIQPFINAADAVFAESLQGPTKIVGVEMDEEAYRRKGVAALIFIKGDIEGRVILDIAPEVAVKVASLLAGTETGRKHAPTGTADAIGGTVRGSLGPRSPAPVEVDERWGTPPAARGLMRGCGASSPHALGGSPRACGH